MSMTMKELGDLVMAGDVAGLERAFSQAADWDTRETVMVAFGKLLAPVGTVARIGEHGDEPAVREQAGSAILNILSLCRAEKKGGSYRENCIAKAEDLLAMLHVDVPSESTARAPKRRRLFARH